MQFEKKIDFYIFTNFLSQIKIFVFNIDKDYTQF